MDVAVDVLSDIGCGCRLMDVNDRLNVRVAMVCAMIDLEM